MGRKIMAVALIVAAALGTFATGPAAARSGDWRLQEMRFARWDGEPGWTTSDVRRLIVEAAERWDPPRCSSGGTACFATPAAKALAVGSCESGSDLLDASTDGYTGTFQQSTRYWDGRRAFYEPVRWDKGLDPSPSNPRSNVVVSIRQAAREGWVPWEAGACA
jgi:hypothetical protein